MTDKELRDYAWDWFEYHAGQRMTAFRFFLIFLGILGVGLSTAFKDGHLLLAGGIAVVGAFVSVAFLMLEMRNEQLVDVGREALKKVEQATDCEEELKLFHADAGRSALLRHKLWLRAIYAVCLLAFLTALAAIVFAVP